MRTVEMYRVIRCACSWLMESYAHGTRLRCINPNCDHYRKPFRAPTVIVERAEDESADGPADSFARTHLAPGTALPSEAS